MSTLAQRLHIAKARKPEASFADLARFCGVTTPSVSNWFSGKTRSMKQEPARRAAEFYGCDQAWLAEGIGLPNWGEPSPAASASAVVLPHTPRKFAGRDALLRVGLMLAAVPEGPRRTALAALMASYVNDGGAPHYVDAILVLLAAPETSETADGTTRT